LRLLLDTTYFLPAIGISVKNLPKDVPLRLLRKEHNIYVSDISVFELAAKGAKYIASKRLSSERVAKGIRAIIYDDAVSIVQMHDSSILLTAFKLRGMLGDFIDCLILSSALNKCDSLITEDSDMLNLNGSKEFIELAMKIKPIFKIRTMAEMT